MKLTLLQISSSSSSFSTNSSGYDGDDEHGRLMVARATEDIVEDEVDIGGIDSLIQVLKLWVKAVIGCVCFW